MSIKFYLKKATFYSRLLFNNSDLYFIRLDQEGEITKAGEPYCTICSKMALEVGIKNSHLWYAEGIVAYDKYSFLPISVRIVKKDI